MRPFPQSTLGSLRCTSGVTRRWARTRRGPAVTVSEASPTTAESVPPEAAGIVTRNVYRRFGPVEALRGLTMIAPYGEVTGLVGPNGAGKTTLLLIVASLLTPDAGQSASVATTLSTRPTLFARLWVGCPTSSASTTTSLRSSNCGSPTRPTACPQPMHPPAPANFWRSPRLEDLATAPVHVLPAAKSSGWSCPRVCSPPARASARRAGRRVGSTQPGAL